MHIAFVTVGYRELRSGAEFSNRSYEVCYTAGVSQGENPDNVRSALTAKAQADVAKFFAGKQTEPVGPTVSIPADVFARFVNAARDLCGDLDGWDRLPDETCDRAAELRDAVNLANAVSMPF
jgi:hypothetical protein